MEHLEQVKPLARAIAGESGITIISIAATSFEDKWIGSGPIKMAELFKQARKHKPCLVFIDEFEIVGGNRDSRANTYRQATTNRLLTEIDGFDSKRNEGIFLIAATNRIDALDPAVLRSGRFSQKVPVLLPNLKERKQLFSHYLKS